MLLLDGISSGVYVALSDGEELARRVKMLFNWRPGLTRFKVELMASRHVKFPTDWQGRASHTNVFRISSPHLYVILTGKDTLFVQSKLLYM